MLARRLSTSAAILFRLAPIFASMACTTPLLAQAPLTMTKAFTPSTVTVGGTATTTITVAVVNPNGFVVNGITFGDAYPTGIVPDQVGVDTCGGNASFNATGWLVDSVTLGAGGSCSVSILAHATTTGQISNTTTLVSGAGVPNGGPGTALLTVLPAASPVPLLSEGMLLLLAMTMAAIAVVRLRDQSHTSPH